MAKTEEDVELQILQEAQRELEALGPDHVLTPEEFVYFVSKMPKMPEGWTSADDVRDFRGPLPEDDPEYQRNFGGR